MWSSGMRVGSWCACFLWSRSELHRSTSVTNQVRKWESIQSGLRNGVGMNRMIRMAESVGRLRHRNYRRSMRNSSHANDAIDESMPCIRLRNRKT